MRWSASFLVAALAWAGPAMADEPVAVAELEPINDPEGYTPPAQGPGAPSPLSINGYVDVGFARAQGDGTSFAPGDARLPADYGVDTFAPAVNSRGDVASIDSDGRFVNGFLPRSAGIGGRASFLLNTLSVDFKYAAPNAPLTVFSRVQLLPRFTGQGDDTRVLVEQAFGRLVPFESQELALSVGKFDSVFGIEYLDNQANIRTGITPSLIARYTTGQAIGAKLFYRIQIAPLWSALSLNVAATNSGTFVEALQPPDASLTGAPVGAGRLGYELNTAAVQVKLGVSAMYGAAQRPVRPRRRTRRRTAPTPAWRCSALYLNAEYVRVDEAGGRGEDDVGGHLSAVVGVLGAGRLCAARVRAAGRSRAAAQADGLRPLRPAARLVRGLHAYHRRALHRRPARRPLGCGDPQGRVPRNRELAGAPTVANNVLTSSLVYSW